MKLLLDTHVLLWYMSDGRISEAVRDLIDDDGNDVYVSVASLFEMAIKIRIGKLEVDLEKVATLVDTFNFQRLPIEDRHCVAMAGLPIDSDHRDPFDALLVAQAISLDLTLVTNDDKLSRYGAKVLHAGTSRP